MAFLIGTVGGLATLFAYIVNPQLHAPARIVVFIAFFALLGAALGLDRLRSRMEVRLRGRTAMPAVLAAVLVIGVLYQTSPKMAPNYSGEIEQYNVRSEFVRAIESQLPGEASIFQLPPMPFPQGADPVNVGAYEDLYFYVVAHRLRWSGGAMEGRPTDWVRAFVGHKPLLQILEGVSAIGFSGLYVDTAGVIGGARLLSTLEGTLGVTPVKSTDGRFAFFNMAAYNRRLREHYSAAQIAGLAAAALYRRS